MSTHHFRGRILADDSASFAAVVWSTDDDEFGITIAKNRVPGEVGPGDSFELEVDDATGSSRFTFDPPEVIPVFDPEDVAAARAAVAAEFPWESM